LCIIVHSRDVIAALDVRAAEQYPLCRVPLNVGVGV